MPVRRVAVLGAGLMGHGIAQVAAQAGLDVYVTDVEQRFLDSGLRMIQGSLSRFAEKGVLSKEAAEQTMARIHPTLDLKEAVREAELVIEAIPEDVELKKKTYRQVDEHAPSPTIFASNTSSISITELASATSRPERFCGMHFFNPPQLMKLVEVIRGLKTSDETIDMVVEAARAMGKEPVVVKKDVVGFIVNRLLTPALNEALFLLEEGVAEPQDIDKAVELGLNWPMGPIRLLDYVGLDTALAMSEVMQKEFGDPKFRVSPLLKQMVRAGLLGRKTGRGFYEWKK